MSEQTEKEVRQAIRVHRDAPNVYTAGMLTKILRKAAKDASNDERTNAGVAQGQREHLIDKMAARDIHDFNTTHSACLDAKSGSTVGMGHRDGKIHEVLDPLCHFSWQDTLDALGDDYWETGECFLEVVYGPTEDEAKGVVAKALPKKQGEAGPERLIVALNHLESAQVYVEVEETDNARDYHYNVMGESGSGLTTVMARFGDLDDLKARYAKETTDGGKTRTGSGGVIVDSEIIHIRQSRNRSRWYGLPDYLSGIPAIELVQCMTQHEFDFYFNRGVPEFILFIIGKSMNTASWTQIENLIKASQGLGNSHKTGAVHIDGAPSETVVQLEKLAMEDPSTSGFQDKSMTLAMLIATAHGVPPILANILLPGKIGAANEGPNALLILQKRKIGPAQKNFSSLLANTLGSGVKLAQPEGAPATLTRDQFLNPVKAKPAGAPGAKPPGAKPKPTTVEKAFPPGGPPKKPDEGPPDGGPGLPNMPKMNTDENGMPIFNQSGNGFCTILDGMTLGAMETLASMKEPIAGSGRDLEEGKLGGADDRKSGDPKKSR